MVLYVFLLQMYLCSYQATDHGCCFLIDMTSTGIPTGVGMSSTLTAGSSEVAFARLLPSIRLGME